MPVDPKIPSAFSRRTSKKLLSEREIEQKRSRGEISCAECRRSKLKCDKRIPCGSCTRRGCSDLCPNDIVPIASDQAARSRNPSDAQHLHQKILGMAQRIRRLEDALAILQSNVSSEPHPLLVEQILCTNSNPDGFSVQAEEDLEGTLESFGTLAIGDSGEHKYFGPSAGSETLLLAGPTLPAEDFDPNVSFPSGAPDILDNLASTSFTSGCAPGSETFESAITMLFAGLPLKPRAWSLCETYLEHSCWASQLTTRQELIEDVLTYVYNAKKEREDPARDWKHCTQISPHKFAFLYLIFAQAVLMDLTLPAYHVDGETYHHYASAAMSLQPLFDNPTVETVQVIVLMSRYRSGAGERYKRDSVWALASLGCKLAQSIGLHRDPVRWQMDDKTVQFRRRLFWEVYVVDLLYSLQLGRPPSLEPSYVDCKLPTYDEEGYDAQYWNWRYQFMRDVIGPVVRLTLAAAPPNYKAILELDRKVREMVPPPALNAFIQTEDAKTYISAGVPLKSFMLHSSRLKSMLFLHRSFFAQALLDHPHNPLGSPYATSFLATYRAAISEISLTAKHFERWPEIFKRYWGVWIQLFTAAIIVGSIATKAPSFSMAPTALMELGRAVDLFERGAGVSKRARTALAILHKLKEKASLAQRQYHSGTNSEAPSSTSLILNSQEDGTDELALFGGQTSVLISKTLARKTSSRHMTRNLNVMVIPPTSSSHDLPSPSPWPDEANLQDIHPSLLQYASLLPPATLSTAFTGQPAPDSEPHSLDQSTIAVNSFVPVAWKTQMPSHLQTEMPSPAVPDVFTNSPNSYDLFQELYQETPATPLDTWGYNDMTDLGQMMNIDSGLDEEWMSFMKECGMFNRA